jgi:hypothetical protein
MWALEPRALADELAALACALEPVDGDPRFAAVWSLAPDEARLVHASPAAPRPLLDEATRRLIAGETHFELRDVTGVGGVVQLCSVGTERAAYGAFVYGDGRPHVESTIDRLIGLAEATLGKQVADMDRTEKQHTVRFLDERGAFLIRKAVEDVADRLGVTRFTIYNYLDRESG